MIYYTKTGNQTLSVKDEKSGESNYYKYEGKLCKIPGKYDAEKDIKNYVWECIHVENPEIEKREFLDTWNYYQLLKKYIVSAFSQLFKELKKRKMNDLDKLSFSTAIKFIILFKGPIVSGKQLSSYIPVRPNVVEYLDKIIYELKLFVSP